MSGAQLFIGDADVMPFAQTIRWGGAYNQCARTLDVSLLCSERFPAIPCGTGEHVRYLRDGQTLFDGYIFSRQKDTGSPTVELGCYDRGVSLKRSQAAYTFPNTTPEAIARRVATDFNLAVGSIAETGVRISRDFPNVSAYKIIQTGYTLAAETTGGRYMVRFRGELLEVVEKKPTTDTLIVRPKSNLIAAAVTEDITNMVNRVVIYDKDGNLVGTRKGNESLLPLIMQEHVKQEEGKNAEAVARRLLDEGGVSQKITLDCVGNHTCIAGNCIIVQEAYTGLYGLFWIDSDTHTWAKDGTYTSKLVVNFRNIMDEAEAGKYKEA